MPTKKVTCNKDKAVVVRVYVEKPMKKSSSPVQQQQHHHHHLHYHIHQTFRQEVVHGPASNNKGYDRRAGLLRYSHLLRESARGSASSTPLLPNLANNNLQPDPTQTATSKKKPRYDGRPGCFGNWKLLIPSFLRSWFNAPKKKKKKKKKKQEHGLFSGNGMRILQVRRSFISNVFSKARKCA